MALELNKIRSAQINEKVYTGEATNPVAAYDIILPESRADLIKETFGAKAAEWEPQTKYVAGDTVCVVDQAGAVTSYECKESHTSGNVFEAGYWRLIVSRRFVTPQDEINWRDGGYALKYKGNYSAEENYKKYDLVSYINNGREEYFISLVDDNKGVVPSIEANSSNWRNLNMWANKAGVSEKIKTEAIPALLEENDSVLLTFVTSNGEESSLFTDSKLVYEVNRNYLDVLARAAENYTRGFEYSKESNYADLADGEVIPTSISKEFQRIYQSIKDAQGEGNFTKGSLNINVNNSPVLTNWNGASTETVNIAINSSVVSDWDSKIESEFANRAETKYVRYDDEQGLEVAQQAQARANIGAAPIADYVIKGADGKIAVDDLPDTVVGGLQYKGTYDASVQSSLSKLEVGDYYIVSKEGKYDPNGGEHLVSGSSELTYFRVGDWAIYDGEVAGWSKIDNTDAVKSVNDRIGDIKTYRGVYSETEQYQAGDWVTSGGILYLAIEASKGEDPVTSAKWQVAGRIYEGQDGIEVSGNVIRHTATHVAEVAEEKAVAANGGQFSVDVNEYDAQGHVVKTKPQNITLSQTWREVKVGETVVAAKDAEVAVSVVGNAPIAVEGDAAAHAIYVKHNAGTEVKEAINLTVESTGAVVANIVSSDKFGHVNGTRELKLINLALKDGEQTLSGVKTYKNELGSGSVILPEAHEAYDLGSTNLAFKGVYAKEFIGKLIGNADSATKWATPVDLKIRVNSGLAKDGKTALQGTQITKSLDGTTNLTWDLNLPESGVNAGVYTAVQVNKQGIVVGGAHVLEFGQTVDSQPSDSLVFGGLFFRMVESN